MEEKGRQRTTAEKLDAIEETLRQTEAQLMRTNKLLGDQYYDRYQNRMGFEKDGSVTRDGVVIWPERMVE